MYLGSATTSVAVNLVLLPRCTERASLLHLLDQQKAGLWLILVCAMQHDDAYTLTSHWTNPQDLLYGLSLQMHLCIGSSS